MRLCHGLVSLSLGVSVHKGGKYTGDGRGLQRQVSVNDVVEARQEDADESEPDEHACHQGHGPMDPSGEAGPAEPRVGEDTRELSCPRNATRRLG